MLSGRDIEIKLLQGHIAIYPLEKDTIDSAGIEVTASKFAWRYKEVEKNDREDKEGKEKKESKWLRIDTRFKEIEKKDGEDGETKKENIE